MNVVIVFADIVKTKIVVMNVRIVLLVQKNFTKKNVLLIISKIHLIYIKLKENHIE